jgi:diketogulonate reductase-like aldo/keto reductase
MALTAYCPIAQGRVFDDPVLKDIASAHGKSPAQITLKWLIDQDQIAAIPRSSNRDHIRSNFEIFDITLSAEETRRINALRSSANRLIDPSWAPAWDVAA